MTRSKVVRRPHHSLHDIACLTHELITNGGILEVARPDRPPMVHRLHSNGWDNVKLDIDVGWIELVHEFNVNVWIPVFGEH